MAGLVAAGGSFSLGTGAFTSTSAKRMVDVAVADDSDAYLSLDSTSEIARSYSYGDPDKVAFAIPSVQDNALGKGVGQNSVYEFTELLEVANRGEDTVVLWSQSVSIGSVESISLIGPTGKLGSKAEGVRLTPGEAVSTGLLIETSDGVGEFSTSLTIQAERPTVDELSGQSDV